MADPGASNPYRVRANTSDTIDPSFTVSPSIELKVDSPYEVRRDLSRNSSEYDEAQNSKSRSDRADRADQAARPPPKKVERKKPTIVPPGSPQDLQGYLPMDSPETESYRERNSLNPYFNPILYGMSLAPASSTPRTEPANLFPDHFPPGLFRQATGGSFRVAGNDVSPRTAPHSAGILRSLSPPAAPHRSSSRSPPPLLKQTSNRSLQSVLSQPPVGNRLHSGTTSASRGSGTYFPTVEYANSSHRSSRAPRSPRQRGHTVEELLTITRPRFEELKGTALFNLLRNASNTYSYREDIVDTLDSKRLKGMNGKDLYQFARAIVYLVGGAIVGEGAQKHGVPTHPMPHDVKFKVLYDADEIKVDKKLGEGNFATTYSATVIGPPSRTVALKMPKGKMSYEEAKDEMVTLLQIGCHPNIVGFVGLVTLHGKPCFLTDYCALGAISKLHEKIDLLQPQTFHRLSMDLARGLAYLHSRGIVHRDIACRNLLMKADGMVVIADYGLARKMELTRVQSLPDLLKETNNSSSFRSLHTADTLEKEPSKENSSSTLTISPTTAPSPSTAPPQLEINMALSAYWSTSNTALPWAWTAPESFSKHLFNEKTDIYMCGVTLWEVLTKGDKPYSRELYLGTSIIIQKIIKGDISLQFPESTSKEALELSKMCLRHNPDDRPTAAGLLLAAGGSRASPKQDGAAHFDLERAHTL